MNEYMKIGREGETKLPQYICISHIFDIDYQVA
jgi:hypothetical protein